MKTKVFLMTLALSCLWSCQQEEETKQPNEPRMSFTGVVIGEGNLTRGLDSDIDIISMSTNLEETFTVLNIKEDTRSWSEYGDVNDVVFYAHYPRLSGEDEFDEETRELTGGMDYLFGVATAKNGQQQVCLEFKHVTSPLQVEILNEDGSIYQGKVKVIAPVKNKGKQDLRTGVITPVNELNRVTLVDGNSRTVNLLPQAITKGTEFKVELEDGRTFTAKTTETQTLKPGYSYTVVINSNGTSYIVDGAIPL